MEGEARERTEAALRQVTLRDWGMRLETARGLYERAFLLDAEGRAQAATACLLRAVELAPPHQILRGYEERPGWAEEAWVRFRCVEGRLPRAVRKIPTGVGPVCLAMDESAARGLVALADGTLRLFDLKEGTERARFLFAATWVHLSADGSVALAANDSGTLVAWETATGRERARFAGPAGWARSLDCSRDGRVAAAVFRDRVTFWNLAEGRSTWEESGSPVTQVHVAADGSKIFAAASTALTIRDAATGAVQTRLPHEEEIRGIWSIPDASLVFTASGLFGASIRAWNTATGRSGLQFSLPTCAARGLRIHPTAAEAMLFLADGTICYVDLMRRLVTARFEGLGVPVSAEATSVTELLFLAPVSDGFEVWDLDPARGRHRSEEDVGTTLAFSRDGEAALGRTREGAFVVWSPESGRVLSRTERRPQSGVTYGAFKRDRTRFVTISVSGAGTLWETGTGRELAVFSCPEASGIDLSPDGERVILASYRDVFLWKASEPQKPAPLGIGSSTCVAFGPEGTRAIAGVGQGTVVVIDMATCRPVMELRGHQNYVNAVALARSGRLAVSASVDGTIRVWNLTEGREQRRLEGHTARVFSVVVSDDDLLVLSGSLDQTARLWDLRTGKMLRSFPGAQAVSRLAFRDVDGHALTRSADGVWIWPLRRPHLRAEPPQGADFLDLFRTVRMRLVPEGPDRGEIKPWLPD